MAAEGAAPVGVLLMAYGTPASPDDVEAYYTHIRRGRPPTPEQVADLRRRYDAIGGVSPLLARTQAQVAAVQAALGQGFVCALGQKHTSPFIADGLAALVEASVSSVVGVVLAPHYSALSVGEYHQKVLAAVGGAAAGAGGLDYRPVESWHLEPGLIDLLAERVRAVLTPDAVVLFTAHSLPARVREMGDPYPAQLAETAAAVASAVGLDEGRWQVAWQSAGRTPEPWLGPDILDVIAGLDAPAVVVCPVGFTSDHLEVLYDVDIEARRAAESKGMRLARTASLNEAVAPVLADVIRRAAP
jgi:ferrochelatase